FWVDGNDDENKESKHRCTLSVDLLHRIQQQTTAIDLDGRRVRNPRLVQMNENLAAGSLHTSNLDSHDEDSNNDEDPEPDESVCHDRIRS
ncbi:hypothetical protein PFISCL1PPCAC_27899, partial [Pristionchus fissidentatus]